MQSPTIQIVILLCLVQGICLLSASKSWAAERPEVESGLWHTYTETDGLPSEQVNSIVQSPDGFLYLATGGGLGRFDGQQFTNVTIQDGLPHNQIHTLLLDREDNVWIGTQTGISRYDGQTFSPLSETLSQNSAKAIFQDSQNNVWFGTDNGVVQYDGQQFKTYTTTDGLAHNTVQCITQDQQGQLWFGTEDGLSRFDGSTFFTFTTDHGLLHNSIRAIYQDTQGQLWFATQNGINRYDQLLFKSFTTTDGLIHNDVLTIFQDKENQIWFGTRQGVSKFDGQNFDNFTTTDGLIHNQVRSIFQDREGYMWFGTEKGLNRYSQGTFVNLTTQSGLVHNEVEPVFQDKRGYLWFGTEEGLSRFDGQNFKNFTTKDGLIHNEVEDIIQDDAGHIWMGTKGGLSKYDGQSFTNYTTKDGLIHNEVEAVVRDPNGYFWLGTEGGLSRFDGQNFKNFTSEDGLVYEEIETMYIDKNTHLWIATKKGLSKFDGQTFTNFTIRDGLIHNMVNAIFQDANGIYWIATEGGVSRYDNKKFTSFTVENGLMHNEVQWIMQDIKGHLWFATQRGISRYNGEIFASLTVQDGLTHNAITRLLQDREGYIWIATKGGITRFSPKYISPAPISITAIMADRQYDDQSDISIPSDTGLLAFEFRAISFKTRPEELRYRYRLRGFDDTWQTTDNQRISFQDLPIGTYTFEVQAIDRDLVLSKTPATTRVRVHLHYTWVIAASIFLIAIIVIGVQTIRMIQRGKSLKILHAELQASHEHLQNLLTHLPAGVCLLNHQKRLITANAIGREYLNQLTQHTPNEPIMQLGTHDLDSLLETMDDTLDQEVILEGPPQQIFAISASSVQEHTKENGWVLVIKDITREREIEERNQEEQHLVSVGRMAAGIAHDFNNILATINGYAEMILEADQPDPAVIRRRLDIILSQGNRAVQLIRQILDFSRRTVAERTPTDLSAFLNQTLQLLRHTLPERVQILTSLDSNQIWVDANPTQLQQVLTNLLLNAADAIPSQGEIRVVFHPLHLSPEQPLPAPDLTPGDWAVVTVSDTGTGIPADAIEYIYEPFFSTKSPTQGSGLGLSQVYGIVKQHGGTITVQSEEGHGTTFSIYLPQCTEPEETPQPVTTEMPIGQKETILIAEDQEEVLQMAKDMLERLNYQVLTAKDGREAETIYNTNQNQIDLVLSDVVMPRLGGFDLYSALKEKNPALRMVMMTGYPIGQDDPSVVPAGVAGFLQKPLQLKTVAETLNEALMKS